MDYKAIYLSKKHFIKAESIETEDYLALFYPFDQLAQVKNGIESSWSVSGDNMMVALTMTFASDPMAKTMSFQREYAEAYDWVAQQFKDWAFTLTTSILYYNDYDLINEDTRNLYRMGMAAFGGIAVGYRVNSKKATMFRIWANRILKEYIIKGYVMDDERLKEPQSYVLGGRNRPLHINSCRQVLLETLVSCYNSIVFSASSF